MNSKSFIDGFQYDVLICTHNGELYIISQIESILKQKIRPQKIIISDDGSTDATLILCLECFKDHAYTNFQIVEGPRKGIASNFFHGARYSTADYLFFSDQDDVWVKDKVVFFADYFSEIRNTIPVLIFSDAYVTDDKLKILNDSFVDFAGLNINVFLDDSILLENCVQGASSAINGKLRDLLLKSLVCIDDQYICMHDWWLAILAKYFGVVSYIDKPLLYYRQHSDNQVGAKKSNNYITYVMSFFQQIKKTKKYLRQIEQLSKVVNHANAISCTPLRRFKYNFEEVGLIKRVFFSLFK